MASELTIKKKNITIETTKDELISIDPTHDGIVFNFKDGIQFYVTDNNMAPGLKNSIKIFVISMNAKKIKVNLDNYSTPVSIEN